ncbi:hypothetical protein D7X33_16630 [Butyricicoccus sp. 1XD8-22]|nr:hypothetical protein D7X33_16630 [Butyricicoccus sp. 1XD8-22]
MRALKLTPKIKEQILKDFLKALDQVPFANGPLNYQYAMEQSGQAGHASIEFSTKAYFKTISYLTFCDKEVGWYGLIERGKKDNEFFVSDIFLYPQFVTAASVRSPQKEFAKWQDGFSAEDFKKLRFFCHSHANMVPTPSGYDLEVQQEITSQLHDDQFFVFMIMNKKHDFWAKICDCEHNRVYEDADIEIVLPYVSGVHEEDIEQEIADNVKSYVYQGAARSQQLPVYPREQDQYSYYD